MGNAVKAASASVLSSQDIKETLGEDETGELKTLSEEPKYLRCLLAKPGQLGSAHYRSSG